MTDYRAKLDTSWQAHAGCIGMDGDLFFPAAGEPIPPEVKATCAACVVRLACLHYAILSGERAGVWGGMGEKGRRAWAKAHGLTRGELIELRRR